MGTTTVYATLRWNDGRKHRIRLADADARTMFNPHYVHSLRLRQLADEYGADAVRVTYKGNFLAEYRRGL